VSGPPWIPLRDLLVVLYDEPKKIAAVLEEVGLKRYLFITTDVPVYYAWTDILGKAEALDKIIDIGEAVKRQYPGNPRLNGALQAYKDAVAAAAAQPSPNQQTPPDIEDPSINLTFVQQVNFSSGIFEVVFKEIDKNAALDKDAFDIETTSLQTILPRLLRVLNDVTRAPRPQLHNMTPSESIEAAGTAASLASRMQMSMRALLSPALPLSERARLAQDFQSAGEKLIQELRIMSQALQRELLD
jgi:Effector-associated domain 1